MKQKPNQYCLILCNGNKKRGIERGHIYRVENPEGESEEYMGLEEVMKKFNISHEKIFISPTDTLCPECGKARGLIQNGN